MRTQYAYLAKDQQTRPLGLRVVEPPPDTLQSARGRLYAVIEFADNTPEGAQRIERALSTIQRTYYTIKGTQSFVLGEALREALQQLTTETAGDTSDLGILLVALLDNRLMAVGAGAVLALFTNGGKVDLFPPGAIGVTETGEPTFDIYRQDSPTGIAFLLAGNYCLEYFSLRELASTVALLKPENLWEIVDDLCQYANVDQLPALLVVTESENAQSKSKTEAKAAPQPSPPRRPFGRLPAALQTPPPVRPQPTMTDEALTASAPATQKGRTGPSTRVPDDDLTTAEVTPTGTGNSDNGRVSAWPAALQQGVQQTKAFFTKILPERSPVAGQPPLPASVAEPAPYVYQEATAYQESKRVPEPTAFSDLEVAEVAALPGGGGVAASTNATLADRLGAFKPPIRASGSRARLYILLALLILILTPVVVMGVYWSRDQRNQAEAERALDMAEASFLAAEGALEDGDKTTARTHLADAQTFILQADSLVGGRLPRGDELSVKIERAMADLLQVQPLYALAAPLVQFLPEAQPRRVIVNAQDIYVFDAGRQLVQYFQLDASRTMVTNVEGEVILQQGTPVDNVAVGELVDMTWQPPIAGVQDKSYLLVLDRNNNIFRYDRRVEGASRVALGGQEQLRKPIRMRVYGDRLYLVDEGASQLFRYSDYAQPPTPWFAAQAQSDLSSLRAIDIDGDIWMLYAQGTVSRYRTGAQVPFSLEDTVGVIKEPVDIAVGDQGNSMVYVADRDQERILVYDKNGAYHHQFRAPEGHPLRDLQALFVDEVENTMYILTQSSLFKHPLTQVN